MKTKASSGAWGLALTAMVLCLSSVSPAARAEVWAGTVTHVTDGDTVWIRPDGAPRSARPLKLRVLGIDAPERCQAWGPQSTSALSLRVLHRRVEVDSRASDDHGRLLGRLSLDGEDVGAWMVLQGHAWSYRFRRSRGPYADREDQARAARRGLFAEHQAEEPRWFRRDHGPCVQPAAN